MMCKDCIHAKIGRKTGLLIAFREGIDGVATVCAVFAVVAALVRPGMAFGADAPPIESSVSIQLWPTAVVTNDRVMLDDVSRISEGDKTLVTALQMCQVAVSPPAGSSTVITIDDVAAALSKAGINATRILLRGSSRCQIVHPGEPASTRPAAAHGRDTKSATTRPASRAPCASGPGGAEPGTLGAIVRQYFTARLADLGGTAEIRFSPAVQRAMALSSPTYEFRIRQRGNDVLGLAALEADVFEGRKLVDTVPIVAEVTLAKAVTVARTAINRGEIIQAKHVMLAERRFSRVADIGISDLQSVIGQEACRYVENGGMLTPRDVRARPLVKRGDFVTVWVRQGDLVIKSVAKALRAGTYGEVVDVKNEATGEVFMVTVTGPQTAEVGRNVASSAVAGAATDVASGRTKWVASAGVNGQ